MAQVMQWPPAIRNCMRRVRLKYQHVPTHPLPLIVFFSQKAVKKSQHGQWSAVFIVLVHVFLWFSARMHVFYCIQTCCQ